MRAGRQSEGQGEGVVRAERIEGRREAGDGRREMEKPHKKLDVWRLAMDLVTAVSQVTEKFPREERYSLTDQIRRAAVSIPSNIAEGAARQTRKEFVNYLHIARGSLSELDTQLELAKRLGYLGEKTGDSLDVQVERIDKMISGLIRRQRAMEGKGEI